MRKYEARIKKLEARRIGMVVVVAPPECEQGTPEYKAFYDWTKAQNAHAVVVVIAHNCSGL